MNVGDNYDEDGGINGEEEVSSRYNSELVDPENARDFNKAY